MPLVDRRSYSVVLRIVYDGPPEAGKTTNLRHLRELLSLRGRGTFESIGGGERAQYFDWLDVAGGWAGGHRVRCQLVSAPGQIELAHRRRHLLDSADAVVFVADSRVRAAPATQAALRSLTRGLGGRADVPLIVQANKQELPGAQRPERFHGALGLAARVPVIAAQAIRGTGVLETFLLAVRLAVDHVRALLVAGELGDPDSDSTTALLRAFDSDAAEVFDALDALADAASATAVDQPRIAAARTVEELSPWAREARRSAVASGMAPGAMTIPSTAAIKPAACVARAAARPAIVAADPQLAPRLRAVAGPAVAPVAVPSRDVAALSALRQATTAPLVIDAAPAGDAGARLLALSRAHGAARPATVVPDPAAAPRRTTGEVSLAQPSGLAVDAPDAITAFADRAVPAPALAAVDTDRAAELAGLPAPSAPAATGDGDAAAPAADPEPALDARSSAAAATAQCPSVARTVTRSGAVPRLPDPTGREPAAPPPNGSEPAGRGKRATFEHVVGHGALTGPAMTRVEPGSPHPLDAVPGFPAPAAPPIAITAKSTRTSRPLAEASGGVAPLVAMTGAMEPLAAMTASGTDPGARITASATRPGARITASTTDPGARITASTPQPGARITASAADPGAPVPAAAALTPTGPIAARAAGPSTARAAASPFIGTDNDDTWELEAVDPTLAIARDLDLAARAAPAHRAEVPDVARTIEIVPMLDAELASDGSPARAGWSLELPRPRDPLPFQLPPADLPASMIWPETAGRAALAQLAPPIRTAMPAAPWAPAGATELACRDGWLAHTAAHLVFPGLHRAHPVLLEAARWHAKLGGLAPPGRAYVLSPEPDGVRLWVLTPAFRTVWAAVEEAFARGDRAAAGQIAQRGLDAVDELRARGVPIADLDHIAIDDAPRLLATPWTPQHDHLVVQLQHLFSAAVL